MKIKRPYWLNNWFSNFDQFKIPIKDEYGIEYYSVERMYQACKTLDKNIRINFTDMSLTEGEIKKLGNTINIRPDWEEVKLSVMENCVRQKYSNNPEHREELIRSIPFEIVEWNRHHDNFWGVCICQKCSRDKIIGKSYLGKILMLIREELK